VHRHAQCTEHNFLLTTVIIHHNYNIYVCKRGEPYPIGLYYLYCQQIYYNCRRYTPF
jgi:hypothetical protein